MDCDLGVDVHTSLLEYYVSWDHVFACCLLCAEASAGGIFGAVCSSLGSVGGMSCEDELWLAWFEGMP